MNDVWAYRLEVEREARVWNAAYPLRGTFYGTHAQLIEQPPGASILVTTKNRASLLRSLGEAWESILGAIPGIGPLFEANNIASSDVQPGHLKGDVKMMFMYWNTNDLTISHRTVWLRHNSESRAMTIISDAWGTMSPSSP